MTIEDIEKAVSKLPPDQLAKFRAWFEAFDAARFDQKIGSSGTRWLANLIVSPKKH